MSNNLTVEQILDDEGFDFDAFEIENEFSAKNILVAMSKYAKQEAILFAQWCSKKNIYPNEYSYTLYKSQTK